MADWCKKGKNRYLHGRCWLCICCKCHPICNL